MVAHVGKDEQPIPHTVPPDLSPPRVLAVFDEPSALSDLLAPARVAGGAEGGPLQLSEPARPPPLPGEDVGSFASLPDYRWW